MLIFKFTTNELIKPLIAAILGLSFNKGLICQRLLGGHTAGRFRSRRGCNIAGNETIGMLKMTSLVSVISLSDLLYVAQSIYSRNFETIPLLLVTFFWYLVMSTIMTFFQ